MPYFPTLMCESVNCVNVQARKRERNRSLISFLHARVFLHGLRADGRGRLGSVAYLRVGRSSRHRSPRLAARHSDAHRYANKHG